jgi:hypothetical protein
MLPNLPLYMHCCVHQASAIGKNMTNAKTFLEKRYSDEMGLEDAVHTSLLTLKEGFEGQVSGSNIEVRRLARFQYVTLLARLVCWSACMSFCVAWWLVPQWTHATVSGWVTNACAQGSS